MKIDSRRGFTLIEVVIVVLLIGILAIIAFPQFYDLRQDTRDAATKASLGGLRSGLSIVTGVIALRENPKNNPTAYPTAAEMAANTMSSAAPANHIALNGNAIMDRSVGIPINPWTSTNTVRDCTGSAQGTILAAPNNNDGWCYNATTGSIWANSNLSTSAVKENTF